MFTRATRISGLLAALPVLMLSAVAAQAQWSDLGLSGREVTQPRSRHGLLYACTSDGLHRKASDTADSSWVLLGFGGERVHDVLAVSAETLLVAREVTGTGADTVALWRSTNGGASWMPFQNGFGAGGLPPDRKVVALLGIPLAPGSILAATVTGRIGKSSDGGMTWKKVFWIGSYFFRFMTSGTSTVWTGGESGIESPIVLRSTDSGETWSPSFVPLGPPAALAMAFDPADPVHAFLGQSGGLLETQDNGGSWGPIPSPVQGSANSALGTRAFAPLRLYTNGLPAQGATVWKTDDEGDTWTSISLGNTGHGSVLALLVHSGSAADTLWLGMASGVLRYVETEVVGVGPPPRPWRLELLMHPSPSSGVATVTFRLPQASRTSLRVLDSAGREIAVLLDGERPAGKHSVVWRAPGLSSGAYFIHLRAGGEVTTRKVVLVQ